MREAVFTVTENTPLSRGIFRLRLEGDMDEPAPGQFVNIKIPGLYLRRPISVCDYEGGTLTLIIKNVGQGTEALSKAREGDTFSLLTGLGNGYDLFRAGSNPVLIGGGVGTPPLYLLCRRLVGEGRRVTVLLGFRDAGEAFYGEEFEALGAKVRIATEDGSQGRRGYVTDLLRETEYSYFYACGPGAMFRAVNGVAVTAGEYSFEERMGCGFGACMGCSVMTKSGPRRVCREGPVFPEEEIIW